MRISSEQALFKHRTKGQTLKLGKLFKEPKLIQQFYWKKKVVILDNDKNVIGKLNNTREMRDRAKGWGNLVGVRWDPRSCICSIIALTPLTPFLQVVWSGKKPMNGNNIAVLFASLPLKYDWNALPWPQWLPNQTVQLDLSCSLPAMGDLQLFVI